MSSRTASADFSSGEVITITSKGHCLTGDAAMLSDMVFFCVKR